LRAWTREAHGNQDTELFRRVFASHVSQALPAELRIALDPLIEEIRSLTNLIKRYHRQIAGIAAKRYPATRILQQIQGVGPLTALGLC
jgi:transposase